MRFIIVIGSACLLSLCAVDATAREQGPVVLALNPQPEPPSKTQLKQSKGKAAPALKTTPKLQTKQLRRQDWRKLNPQPEPPKPVGR
ncbi:MAG: hypothetical protein M3R18_09615 [Pseudomonadota bacterium]|nr:hypothetical protein [Pseudomonadota bacterium]